MPVKLIRFTFALFLIQLIRGDINIHRIVNGTDVTLGEAPYAVSVRYFDMHECGGSIIGPKWILTAAHCVYPNFANVSTVLYGSIYLQNGETLNCRVKEVLRGFKHERYVPSGGYVNDVGLLELKCPLVFNNFVGPVKLPLFNEPTPAESAALLVGWGFAETNGTVTNVLQKVNIIIFSEEFCQKAHDGLTNPSVHVCAGAPEGGKGQCTGDSGGPLTVNNVQFGIVSWSVKPCTVAGYPGVFSRVAAYRDWIYQETGI